MEPGKRFVRLMDKLGNIVGEVELGTEQATPDTVRVGAQAYVSNSSSVIAADGGVYHEYIESIVLELAPGTFAPVELIK